MVGILKGSNNPEGVGGSQVSATFGEWKEALIIGVEPFIQETEV